MTDITDTSAIDALQTHFPLSGSLGSVAKTRTLLPAVETGRPRLDIVSRAEVAESPRWPLFLLGKRKDRRYYAIVEDTLEHDVSHHYLVFKDKDGDAAIQPFFITDVDLLEGIGGGIKAIVNPMRALWPRFLKARTLMMGCFAGEGALDGDERAQRRCAAVLGPALVEAAGKHDASMIVLKEFPPRDRAKLGRLTEDGFIRLPSMPMTSLDIGYPDFDTYMAHALSHATRKNLRRKFRAAERAAPIELSVLTDVSAMIDEVYPLYLATYERSDMHFEKLTPAFLAALGQRMPDCVRFFVWRQNGRVIAFSMCMIEGDAICDEYIGLDYSVAIDLHLYHYTFRDIVRWAMAHGLKTYRSTGLSYDPKLHLRCRLDALDLYVRHRSRWFNPLFKLLLPWLEPVQYDKNLKRFANYHELRG